MQNHFPVAYKLMKALDDTIKKGIDPLYFEIIKIRASQLNGGAYWPSMDITDTGKLNANPQRLYVLNTWRNAKDWFSEEEQVILRLTEEVFNIDNHGVSDELYDHAEKVFGETKLSHILIAAVVFTHGLE
jgi:alkylhydroperoxidase family enzyme